MKRLIFLTAVAVMLSSCNIQPEAFFYADKLTAEIGEEIYFTNGSHNAKEFEWDFGDGTWSDAYEVVHSYSASGTFTCLLYTSPSPRDRQKSRMPSSA